MYERKSQCPTSLPNPTSRKRGHRFDEAMAAKHQRAQSSGSRGAGQTTSTSLTSKAETNVAAARLISEKKQLLREAAVQESAASKKNLYAHNVVVRLGSGSSNSYQGSGSDDTADSDTTGSDYEVDLLAHRAAAEERKEEARRKLRFAEARTKDRYAALQAVTASFRHPNAAQEGKWSILSDSEQETLLSRLKDACHDHDTLTSAGYQGSRVRAPRANPNSNSGKRRVVAIDCEFVGITKHNISVLAQVCAVDVLTGEVLLDFLVEPGHRKVIYRTRHSGLTGHVFHRYREMGLVLPDVAAAQEALFEFVDRDTILVGFAMENDFEMLGVSHWRVFDTQLAVREAELKASRVLPKRWSLQSLSSQFFGRLVQQSSWGHNCLEDAFAARELMLWWVKEENEDQVEEWVQWQGRRNNGGSTFDVQNWL